MTRNNVPPHTRFASAGVALASLVYLYVSACAPAWHSGDEPWPLVHGLDRAAVYPDRDSLAIQGSMNLTAAFTDYGVKLYSARDNTGKPLSLRSFQIFWMKEIRFEIEVDRPSEAAESVDVDVAFTSRSGMQRVQETLPIVREAKSDYRKGHGWETRRVVAPPGTGRCRGG